MKSINEKKSKRGIGVTLLTGGVGKGMAVGALACSGL